METDRTSKYVFSRQNETVFLKNELVNFGKFLVPCKYLKRKYTNHRSKSLECTHKDQVFLVASHYLSFCFCNLGCFSRALFALKVFRILICRCRSAAVASQCVGVLVFCFIVFFAGYFYWFSIVFQRHPTQFTSLWAKLFTMQSVDCRERGLIHPPPPTLKPLNANEYPCSCFSIPDPECCRKGHRNRTLLFISAVCSHICGRARGTIFFRRIKKVERKSSCRKVRYFESTKFSGGKTPVSNGRNGTMRITTYL